jgi:DinB family protein
MSTRATLLAQRIEQGADALAVFAEGLSEAQWRTVVQPDGRPVGVIIHHVASVYPIEIHLATEVAAGKAITEVTWAAVATMNAQHAHEHDAAGRQETIELLRLNSRAAAEAVRAFTDEQLDRAAPVSLNANAPLTAQFLVEDHAVRHSWHHLAKIKAVLQAV